MPDSETSPADIEHIFVCVHGIGKQRRGATARAVANRLASSKVLFDSPECGQENRPPFHPQPLGYFHSSLDAGNDNAPVVQSFRLESLGEKSHPMTEKIAVAEIFWADIPQKVVNEGRTLQETKEWAHTVVGRARRSYYDREQDSSRNEDPDFGLAAQVLDEIIDTVRTIEKIARYGPKIGLPEIDVRAVFEEFLGDVQFMAEFEDTRRRIVQRFSDGMQRLDENHPTVKFHIVAHSEGTVVSFLGLLEAMSNQNPPPKWVKRVSSYMTIGSPIDKHLLLWPDLFEGFDLAAVADHFEDPTRRIRWKNYFDYGDPVGFRLDTANRWLNSEERMCKPFVGDQAPDAKAGAGKDSNIEEHGFARYPYAGKAHNDYWEDPQVFEHFLDQPDFKDPDSERIQRPRTRPLIYVLSPSLPYVVSFVLFVGAVTAFYALVSPLHGRVFGSSRDQVGDILGLSTLLIGVTLAARIPRLAVGWSWKLWGLAAFVLGSVGYLVFATHGFQEKFGAAFTALCDRFGTASSHSAAVGTIIAAAALAAFGLISTKRFKDQEEKSDWLTERKKRWFLRGMRPFLMVGIIALTVMGGYRLQMENADTAGENQAVSTDTTNASSGITTVSASLAVNASSGGEKKTPVKKITFSNLSATLLGTLVFFYLWWLAALIFDLGFVWQRYVRHGLVDKRVDSWVTHKSANG